MTAFLRPERPYRSRAEQLHDMARLVFEGPAVTRPVPPPFCFDPEGRDILATPAEVDAAACAECKKQAIRRARELIDQGRDVDLVFSVVGGRVQHVSIRVDGVPEDPAARAGMPPAPSDINRGAVIVRVVRAVNS